MSSENGWIPWDERENIQKYVVVKYSMGLDYNDSPIEICDYYYLGNIPNEYVAEFEKEIDDPREDLCIKTIEQLNEQEINQALRFFVLHKDDKKGAGVYLWNLKRTYEKADKLKYELFCNNKQSTLESVPDVSDSPAVPASAPADKDLPADKTAKPERQKATKEDIQNAIAELQKYFRSNNTDYMQKTIIKHLEEKLGIVFDLSPRTKLGKCYAVLYYDKTGTPPRNWTVSKILDVKKELGKKVS